MQISPNLKCLSLSLLCLGSGGHRVSPFLNLNVSAKPASFGGWSQPRPHCRSQKKDLVGSFKVSSYISCKLSLFYSLTQRQHKAGQYREMQTNIGMKHKKEHDRKMENSLSRVGNSLLNISVLIQDLFKSQI